MSGYLGESLTPVKRQKSDYGSVFPVMVRLLMSNGCLVRLLSRVWTSRAIINGTSV